MIGFVIRLIGWVLLLGCAARYVDAQWTARGLDQIDRLVAFHQHLLVALYAGAIILAIVGFGRWRAIAIFAGFFLAGIALTAPWAIARVVGA